MKEDKPKPICILFAGPVGSSKTPVAYYLSWNLNLPIFNNDAIRTEVLEDTLSPEIDDDLHLKIRNERLEKLIKSKNSFIYDASIDRTWFELKDKLKESNYCCFIISFNLSLGLLLKMFKAKRYGAGKEQIIKWYDEHKKFLEEYDKEVNFVINDENFPNRLEETLQAVKKNL